MNWFLAAAWAFGLIMFWAEYLSYTKLEIKDKQTGALYLTRYHLFRCKWFRVFLHHIHLPDGDRDLHNHPWPNAFSLILRGGYEERWIGQDSGYRRRRYVYGRTLRAGTQIQGKYVNRLTPDCYHRIDSVFPKTWTLFFAGRRSRRWGFLVNGEHIDWTTYLGLPYDTELGD